MRKYDVSINGKTYPVTLLEKQGTSITFSWNEQSYTVDVSTPMPDPSDQSYIPSASLKSGSSGAAVQAGPGQVCAPMPGIITSILVKEGQEVKKGDPVLIIEAMKMENNIPAPDSGKVKEIQVAEGQEVEKGSLLISIEMGA